MITTSDAVNRVVGAADIINDAVHHAVQAEVTKAVANAKAELDRKIPEIVGGITIHIAQQLSMQTIGHELIIRIRLDDLRKK